jgi:hypothetical protein
MWIQWIQWNQWNQWNQWDQWALWVQWALWIQWDQWAQWIQWNQWAQWIQWNQWDQSGPVDLSEQHMCQCIRLKPMFLSFVSLHQECSFCILYTNVFSSKSTASQYIF